METPSKGRTFGWDKYFQWMISRHNRWEKGISGVDFDVDPRYLESPVGFILRRLIATGLS